VSAGKRTYKEFTEWLLPEVIRSCFANLNDKLSKEQIMLKGLLGSKSLNLKIILTNGDAMRAGIKAENGRITKVVNGGLSNPSMTISATESAIHRLRRSSDTFEMFRRERRLGTVVISGQKTKNRFILDVLLMSADVLKYMNGIFSRQLDLFP